MFRETEGPVVVLFIAVIVILLYNYVGEYIEVNNQLNDTVDKQQAVITQQAKENKQLADLVGYLYYRQTGKHLPNNWTLIPKDEYSPTH